MKNKWLIALSAIGIHICIGSVYAWSVLVKPIMFELGVTLQDTQWIFSLAIFFLGTSAAFLGEYVEKYGPKISGLVSTLFFCVGMFGSGMAISYNSLPLLYIFYGIIGGIGLGIGYITPVSTLVKWFPENKGFATGIAIMGFGFASLIAGPIIQILIEQWGLNSAFKILSLCYMVIMIPSALYLAPPNNKQLLDKTYYSDIHTPNLNSFQAIKTWKFYALWWMLFVNITCGIGLLSILSPMAQELVKLSPIAAATMVGIVGLLNGFGRLMWSSLSDYIGRANTYISFFIIQIIAFFLLTLITDNVYFQLLIYTIITCYGGGFATIPAFLSDLFGNKYLSAIHGKILTAWALAGIVGPLLVSVSREITGNYTDILIVFIVLFFSSLIVSLFVKFHYKLFKEDITQLYLPE